MSRVGSRDNVRLWVEAKDGDHEDPTCTSNVNTEVLQRMESKWKYFKQVSLLCVFLAATFSMGFISNNIMDIPSLPYFTHSNNNTEDRTTHRAKLPHQHIYYLKTHKTGSTTMYAILAEYSRSHELVPLLPRKEHINQGGRILEKQLMMLDNVKKYDMVFSHHVFSPKILTYLHNDSFRMTSLRDPFDNFVSAFLYYRNKFHINYLMKVPTADPLTEFLRHPGKYDVSGYATRTNNRQSMDLGYDLTKGFNNIPYIKQFINESDRRFDLVLIMEYFDEGLVMMKRALHWDTGDILYFTHNAGSYYKKGFQNKTSLEKEQRRLHAKFSQADIMLYDHFLKRFKEAMNAEVGLQEEVKEFRRILMKFSHFCDTVGETNERLVIPPSKWNNQFQLTRLKCTLLSFDFVKLTNFIQERQRALFSLPTSTI